MKFKKNFILTISILMAGYLQAQTWSNLSVNTSVNLWGVYFLDEDRGFVCGDSGTILKTTNGGETWIPVSSGGILHLAGIQMVNANTGYIASWFDTGGKLLKTTDGGDTWFNINMNIPNRNCGGFWFFDKDTGLLALGDNNYSNSRILKTVNGGNTWDTVYTGGSGWLSFIHFPDRNNGYATVSGSVVLKTNDGGNSWTKTTDVGGSLWMSGVYFFDNSNGFVGGGNFATGGGSIFRTTDGGNSWQTVSTEFGTSIMYFPSAEMGFAIGSKSGWNAKKIIKSTDSGNTWAYDSTPRDSINWFCFPSEEIGYAVGDKGCIMKYSKLSGINEAKNRSFLFNLYPNPSSDQITLSFTHGIASAQIRIYNLLGQIVYSGNIEKATENFQLDIHTYPQGIYDIMIYEGVQVKGSKRLLVWR